MSITREKGKVLLPYEEGDLNALSDNAGLICNPLSTTLVSSLDAVLLIYARRKWNSLLSLTVLPLDFTIWLPCSLANTCGVQKIKKSLLALLIFGPSYIESGHFKLSHNVVLNVFLKTFLH